MFIRSDGGFSNCPRQTPRLVGVINCMLAQRESRFVECVGEDLTDFDGRFECASEHSDRLQFNYRDNGCLLTIVQSPDQRSFLILTSARGPGDSEMAVAEKKPAG
jgi:hypothetical protein